MRSVRSFCNGAVLRSDLRRFWPVAAVYALIWIVAMPLQLGQAQRYGYGAGEPLQYMADQTLHLLPMAAVMACLFGAAAAMALTGYLMSGRAVGTLHAMPVTRTGLYLTHFTAGFALYSAANLAVVILSVPASAPVTPWAALGWWLLMAELMGFFFLALGFFAAMLTGWQLLTPAAYGLVQFVVLMVTGLLRGLGNVFYYGYRSAELPEAVLWLTPTVKLVQVCREAEVYGGSEFDPTLQVNAIAPETVGAAVVYAAAGAVLAALGCLLYNARRSEAAGDAVAFRPLQPVVKYVGAVGCGIAGGLLLHIIVDVPMLAGTAACTVIVYFAIEMILKKSLRVLRRGWGGALIACAAAAAVCLLVQTDAAGYQTRVPETEDVAAVRVQLSRAPIYDVWLEDGETIRATQELHRRIVDEFCGKATPERNDASMASAYVALEYRLKNGGSICRAYTLTISEGSQLHKLYRQLACSPEVQWHSVMGALSPTETPPLVRAQVDTWGSEESKAYLLEKEDALRLYEAIRADLLAGRNGEELFAKEDSELCVSIQFYTEGDGLQDPIYGRRPAFSGYVQGLNATCTETVDTLMELGIDPDSLSWQEPKAVLEYTDGE
ncbi:MAG: hypothetical protein IJU18_06165 [Oscillospiraceae bacterium]|nr:hypothetical protein [Oscillospiraceae bacterium]